MTTATYATDSRPGFTGIKEFPGTSTGSLEDYVSGDIPSFINSAAFRELNEKQLIYSALTEYINRRRAQTGDKMLLSFVKKMASKMPLFESISINGINKAVTFVTLWVMLTNPEKASIDVTDDQSVVFTIIYPNGEDAYLELFFEAGESEPVQHNLAIYKQGEPVFAFGGSFQQTLVKFLGRYGQQIEIPI